jgi:hypothetical protein
MKLRASSESRIGLEVRGKAFKNEEDKTGPPVRTGGRGRNKSNTDWAEVAQGIRASGR